MGIFGFGKKREVVDLTENYKRQQEKISNMRAEIQEAKVQEQSQNLMNSNPSSSSGMFGFFDNPSINSTISNTSNYNESFESDDVEEKKRKLAKRLSEMTDRIEDLSNQIYRLSQRLELVERKIDIRR